MVPGGALEIRVDVLPSGLRPKRSSRLPIESITGFVGGGSAALRARSTAIPPVKIPTARQARLHGVVAARTSNPKETRIYSVEFANFL
jgi:hypothetical protein